MRAFIQTIDLVNRLLGRAVSWCLIAMMLAQMGVVISRHVFGYGTVALQEAVVFGHALVFLLASAWVLQRDEHVRVDILYDRAAPGVRRIIDLAALVLFVLPVAGVIAWYGWDYAAHSFANLEGSRQPGGLGGVFLLKGAIVVFAVSVGLQGLSQTLKIIPGLPPARPAEAP
ncbi:TRAP transporter small permease subunit [Tepidamorphus sp. 3E244]|uniref:TRAP transporter small permease subunit n=1 Tax=Tepidamorphus sp. 3E244 TaxID=3385498 RepID=UPI0038FC1FA2